jgi:hypothetical protein
METRASTKRKTSVAVSSPSVSEKGKKGTPILSGQPDTETTALSGSVGVISGSVQTEGKEKEKERNDLTFDDLKFLSPKITYVARNKFKLLNHRQGNEFLDSLSDAMLERCIIPHQLKVRTIYKDECNIVLIISQHMIDEPVNDHSILVSSPWTDKNLRDMQKGIPRILNRAGRYRHAGSEDNLCHQVVKSVLELALSLPREAGDYFSM